VFEVDQIPAALRRYVPDGATLTFPTQGMTSEVAIVGGGHPVVLKRCHNALYLSWLSREQQVLKLLEHSGLPMPRLVDYAETGDDSRREMWLVMSRLQGRDLRSELQAANPRRRVELYRHVGLLLRRLHATPVPSGFATDAPWIDRQLTQAAQNLSWCDGTPELLADLRRRRPPPVSEVLIHGDLALDNVLIDADGTMSLIDWSGGDVGDPRFDISLALRTETTNVSQDQIAAFFNGYGDVPLDERTQQWFEHLYEFF